MISEEQGLCAVQKGNILLLPTDICESAVVNIARLVGKTPLSIKDQRIDQPHNLIGSKLIHHFQDYTLRLLTAQTVDPITSLF